MRDIGRIVTNMKFDKMQNNGYYDEPIRRSNIEIRSEENTKDYEDYNYDSRPELQPRISGQAVANSF